MGLDLIGLGGEQPNQTAKPGPRVQVSTNQIPELPNSHRKARTTIQ